MPLNLNKLRQQLDEYAEDADGKLNPMVKTDGGYRQIQAVRLYRYGTEIVFILSEKVENKKERKGK